MKYYSIAINDYDSDWDPITKLFVIEAENSYSAWFKLLPKIEDLNYLPEFDGNMQISCKGLYLDERDTKESAELNIKKMNEAVKVTFVY
jgi:hypothetical protein